MIINYEVSRFHKEGSSLVFEDDYLSVEDWGN